MAIRLTHDGTRLRGTVSQRLQALCLLLGAITAPPVLAETGQEHLIKAAFIEKFTRFTDWPDLPSAGDPRQPFVLCVAGTDPVARALDDLTTLTEIKDRRAIVRRDVTPATVENCHVLFISGSESDRLPIWIAYLRGKPILTVGDTPGFGERGVIVNFVMQDKRVHFEINHAAGQAAGLSISSRLLSLARVVGRK